MSADEYSEASRQGWGAAADAWARAGEEPDRAASAEAGAWMLEAAQLEPGLSVLELACGAGRVGLQAAKRVGEEGRVVCSDFAEPMVEATRARAKALGLGNVRTRVLDAQALDLEEDERFDRVLCRFGFMLMGDPLRALEESRRALAPGGALVLAVWGTAEENPWLATILNAVVAQFGAPPPEPGSPGPFALGDEDRLAGLLRDAGFQDASVARLQIEQTYDSLDAWWEQVLAAGGPLAMALGALPEADVASIRARAMDGAAPFATADGLVEFPATVLGAVAREGSK